ncbi:hypothetical protein [Pseudorhizobium flavum]|uniref:hypothetical protein n=1 Tax=Pseudorhizobium flavum TaxID=1335061 RepID=UPI0024908F23|nr:hypothetical protein [Pseudorhizobium flavum]
MVLPLLRWMVAPELFDKTLWRKASRWIVYQCRTIPDVRKTIMGRQTRVPFLTRRRGFSRGSDVKGGRSILMKKKLTNGFLALPHGATHARLASATSH